MPLTNALQADFSDFVNESNKASAALGQMENEAKKTGATLAKTGQAVDGMGEKSAAGLTQLTTGLRAVDASANAMGYSLAKPIGMIDELSRVSTVSAGSLGMLGSAAQLLGAALVGIEAGKYLADWTGMAETAKNLQDRFLGWNDSADAAANRQAVLALALQRTGKTFTDVNEAMAANQKWVKDHAVEVGTATHRQAEWEKEIRKHRAELPEMLAAIANHTASVKQLHEQYHISEEALTFYIAKTKDQTAAQKEAASAAKAQVTAQAELTELRKGYGVQLMSINAETLKAVQADLALGAGQATVAAAYGLTAQQVKAASEQLELQLKITTGLGAEWANVGEKVKITADSVVADSKRMQDAARAYQAETDRMVDEAQQVKPPITAAADETEKATGAAQKWTMQLREVQGAAKLTVSELLQAGLAADDAYRKAGLFVNDIGAAGTARFLAASRAGVMMPTTGGDFTTAMQGTPGVGQKWGTGVGATSTTTNLNVNVNSTDANNIASKLVTEMRHQGVRF